MHWKYFFFVLLHINLTSTLDKKISNRETIFVDALRKGDAQAAGTCSAAANELNQISFSSHRKKNNYLGQKVEDFIIEKQLEWL